ncbi:Type cbb3 cytochrome oxidase biogenesis protein CcoI; Copper-translocating P-type ATPase (EC [uncultured Gammaproteobacteria bacterium]|nr:Type cbb3 cytochrome oxidase biogenesis protein CcoI; Copper-translocating P-type ATPase (EC [uncultured Gammaproteobacteria bacterium]
MRAPAHHNLNNQQLKRPNFLQLRVSSEPAHHNLNNQQLKHTFAMC